MAKINRVHIYKIKQNALGIEARKEAGRLWTDIVKLHKYIRKRHWKWPNSGAFEKHFKGKYNLHSQTIQAIIQKFFSNMDTIRKLRKAGDKKASFP